MTPGPKYSKALFFVSLAGLGFFFFIGFGLGQRFSLTDLERGVPVFFLFVTLVFSALTITVAGGRYLAERIARKTELERNKMRGLFQRAPAAIGIFEGPDLIRTFSNDVVSRIYRGKRIVGLPLSATVNSTPEAQYAFEQMKRVYETGVPVIEPETRFNVDWTGSGQIEERYLSTYLQPTYDRKGKVDGVITFALDVTQHVTARESAHRAQQQQRASERKFSAIYENAPFAICLVSTADMKIADANPAFVSLFEYSREEILGRTSVEIGMHGGDLEARNRIAEEYSRTGSVRNAENQVRTKSGRSVSVTNNLETVEIEGLKYILVTLEDITLRKRAENELKRAIHARDEFLSVASHELRTPLTSLKLQTQAFQLDLSRAETQAYSAERVEKLVRTTERQVDRLARLVDDMLDVSRIQTGRLSIHPELVELCQLVADVVDRLSSELTAACGVLPKTFLPEAVTGRWDRLRIEQVFINLLNNAMRYGKGTPIEVRVEIKDSQVRLCVTDSGIGISKQDQEKIFDRYERAIHPDEVSGLGLGLFISRQIAEAHGGKIRVESELGKGSTFLVELPLDYNHVT